MRTHSDFPRPWTYTHHDPERYTRSRPQKQGHKNPSNSRRGTFMLRGIRRAQSIHTPQKAFESAPIGGKRNMKRSTFLAPSNAAPNNACQNNPKGMKLIIRSVLSMHSLLDVHSTLPRKRNEPQASCQTRQSSSSRARLLDRRVVRD